jgi:hypothetical protein
VPVVLAWRKVPAAREGDVNGLFVANGLQDQGR